MTTTSQDHDGYDPDDDYWQYCCFHHHRYCCETTTIVTHHRQTLSTTVLPTPDKIRGTAEQLNGQARPEGVAEALEPRNVPLGTFGARGQAKVTCNPGVPRWDH